MPNQNGDDRLNRIERALELLIDDHVQFREEHKQLLTAQVLLTDSITKLADAQAKLAEAQKTTDEQLRTTDDRLNALITIVDGVIRNRQKPEGG